MRALRVVGLDEDGETVICEDPENGERFSVPADERLRAAARGDLTRLGQVQIELEAQMRPKEIQARIRGGATVAQLASASGLPEQRLERYAYPVLLERAQIAEMAQRAHPVREDGPDVQTLGEVAAHTFGMRGHDYNETHWDAWRGDDNKWVVQLRWNAGRSENAAHWVFHPGAHGGTVSSLDEHAVDLLDPSPNRPLRTVRPVTALAREALELDQLDNPPPDEPPGDDPPPPPPPPRQQPPAARTQRSESASTVPPLDLDGLSPAVRQPRSEQRAEPAARQSRPEQWPDPPARQPRQEPPTKQPRQEPPTKQPRHEPPAEPTGQQDEAHQELEPPEQDEERKTEPTQQRGRKNHPIVPSWEDVLLGVRSHR